jgi:hypothetical protein
MPSNEEINEAAERLKIHPDSIRRRIKKGMPPELALTKPNPTHRQRAGWSWDHIFPRHRQKCRAQGKAAIK